MKFITYLIVISIVFSLLFNIYDWELKSAKVEILTLLTIGIMLGVMTILGKMFQKNFPKE
ncbi:hypothetical protein LXN10_02560 [Arcobacter sp. KX21116]|uniref:hypothetical protein n=1 Tax=Arcobacter iocasae TaxID=2906515 RepID=UPI0035D51D36